MIKYIFIFLLCITPLHAQTALPDTQQTPFSLANAIAVHKVLAVGIGPRPMGSPAERRALRFAMEKFKEYGCDTAYIMTMNQSTRANTSSGIAVGIKRGATKRIIVIGGHIDSSGPEIPGADDNASGSAVVIEAARVLCKTAKQSTLVFTCFGGEEQGLEGSRYFVSRFTEIDSVVLMLNIDMANGLETIDIDGDMHGLSAPPWLIIAGFREFEKLGYKNLRYPTHAFTLNYAGRGGAGSDHEPFLAAGIPAVDFSTDVTRPIHTPQDHIEHFDPRGMKRSGDVVLKLVEQFDGGVPDKNLTNYWLNVVGGLRIFVPYVAIHVFVVVAILLAIVAFVVVRKRRIVPVDVPWSGVRALLYTAIIVFFAWISSDVVGVLKGVRYPWFADISPYYLNAALFGVFGIWVSSLLAKRLPLSRCPYIFYKRASIILLVFTLLFLWGSTKLAIYPASALFLVALAIVVRLRFLKIFLAALSPVWMILLIFNEWDGLFFRSIAGSGISITSIGSSLLYNIGLVVLLSLYVYPLVLGVIAVYRDSGNLQFSFFRPRTLGYTLAALMVASVVLLSLHDSYSDLWQRTVVVEHSSESENYVVLRSAEYLDGVVIRRPEGDTTLSGRIVEARIPVNSSGLQPPNVAHKTPRNRQTTRGDSTEFDVLHTINFQQRPYTVTATYYPEGGSLEAFSSPLLFTGAKLKTVRWYSFPDSVVLPVRFQFVPSRHDSESTQSQPAPRVGVEERIETVFDRLMFPWTFEREKTNFILRTKLYRLTTHKP